MVLYFNIELVLFIRYLAKSATVHTLGKPNSELLSWLFDHKTAFKSMGLLLNYDHCINWGNARVLKQEQNYRN